MNKIFSANEFYNLDDLGFCPQEYSQLKFGSDIIAKKFGYELAEKFFTKHADIIMSNNCVVIPSPYNHVENAATRMTKHFVNKLNELLVEVSGNHVEYSIIHRKVTYTSDYGFLSKEKRKGLIGNDSFYFNREFVKGKLLIFIDDVRITGTHEEKLIDVMEEEKLDNDSMFLYFGRYFGNSPNIEAEINFAGIKNSEDYLKLVTGGNCHVIVRTIKYVLGLHSDEITKIINQLPSHILNDIYYGSLGEGYYKVPSYQRNLELIKNKLKG